MDKFWGREVKCPDGQTLARKAQEVCSTATGSLVVLLNRSRRSEVGCAEQKVSKKEKLSKKDSKTEEKHLKKGKCH